MSEGRIWPQIFYGLGTATGAFLMGCCLGATLPNDHDVQKQRSFQDNHWGLQNWWVRALLPLAAMGFSKIAAIDTRFRGPMMTLRIAALVFFVAFLLLIAYFYNNENRQDYDLLCVYRVILALSCGFVTLAFPLLMAEIAHNRIRGALCCLFHLHQLVGMLTAYCVLMFGEFYWIYIAGFFPVLLFVASAHVKLYSPLFLMKVGEEEVARVVLAKLRGRAYDSKNELDALRVMAKKANDRTERFFQRFQSSSSLRAVLICVGLIFFQQFSGIHAVVLTTVETFKDAPYNKKDHVLIIVLSIQIMTALIALLIVDVSGRRVLLLISSGFMSLGMLLLVVAYFMKLKDSTPLAGLVIFVAAFSIGFGPVPWIYMAELLSLSVREHAAALVCGSFWLFRLINADLYIELKAHIDNDSLGYFYCVFLLFGILAFFFVLFLVPETKQKNLLELQDILVKPGTVTKDA